MTGRKLDGEEVSPLVGARRNVRLNASQVERLLERYRVEQVSVRELAAEFGIDRSTLLLHVQRAGLPRRNESTFWDEATLARAIQRYEDGTTHTYFHGLGKSPTVPLYSRIKVLETPPGQTFRACVFALVQYGLLVTTGAFIDRLLSAQDLPMDLPALLLAVPGLVSVLMLPLSDSGLVALPLLTRVALMSNGFLSLASAVTYMILRSIYGAVPNGDSPPVPVWVVLLWLSMAAASAVVLLVTFHRLVETWREFRKAHVSLVVLPAST